MSSKSFKFIIIGAGLSGLVSARRLMQQGVEDFIILEGRDRIGGRINTHSHIDLGATWFQTHHTALSELLGALDINKFRQYTEGQSIFIYSSMAPPQYFKNDQNNAAFRIEGGSIDLINKLALSLDKKTYLNTRVTEILEDGDRVKIKTTEGLYAAQKVILTIPPQLATQIHFSPALPHNLKEVMSNTHTWMSNAIKVGITYDRPFWRMKQLSGTIVGHISPVIELYDHSNYEGNKFGLMGFVNEGLRNETAEGRKERIMLYLEKHFGKEVRNHNEYLEKDWSTDIFTSSQRLNSVYISPNYGNPLFEHVYLNGKVKFSGAETSSVHGGYMDGAILSGNNAVDKFNG